MSATQAKEEKNNKPFKIIVQNSNWKHLLRYHKSVQAKRKNYNKKMYSIGWNFRLQLFAFMLNIHIFRCILDIGYFHR